jgi:hypothetical protein
MYFSKVIHHHAASTSFIWITIRKNHLAESSTPNRFDVQIRFAFKPLRGTPCALITTNQTNHTNKKATTTFKRTWNTLPRNAEEKFNKPTRAEVDFYLLTVQCLNPFDPQFV